MYPGAITTITCLSNHVLYYSHTVSEHHLLFMPRYGTYLRAKGMPGGEKLVAFTRILHRTKPDVLVEEIPTFRAHPLTPKCDIWCEFPVSDRPDAVEQWLEVSWYPYGQVGISLCVPTV